MQHLRRVPRVIRGRSDGARCLLVTRFRRGASISLCAHSRVESKTDTAVTPTPEVSQPNAQELKRSVRMDHVLAATEYVT